MSKKSNAGRPSKMNETTLGLLKQGFAVGLTDREACLFAGIHPSTLYNYCNANPEFFDQKELLKEQPKIKAKFVLAEAIEGGDVKAAQWYLERRAKEEFSPKFEATATFFEPVQIVADLLPDEAAF